MSWQVSVVEGIPLSLHAFYHMFSVYCQGYKWLIKHICNEVLDIYEIIMLTVVIENCEHYKEWSFKESL